MKRTLILSIFLIKTCFGFSQAPGIEWQRSIGGNFYDRIQDIIGLEDGGYFTVGSSSDTNILGNHGVGYDCWAVRLDSTGNMLWQKCYGGTSSDYANATKQTKDRGFIIVGSTHSNDGDITSTHGSDDFWIIKIDSVGNLQWQKCYGGSSSDGAFSVELTEDGGFIVSGSTISNDGDVTPDMMLGHYWVIKLDSIGNKEWAKSFGGPSSTAYSIKVCNDNGYIFGGVGGYVFKTDSVGQILWQKYFGSIDYHNIMEIQLTADSGYVFVGVVSDTTWQTWVVKIDKNGNKQWEKLLGGTGNESGYSIYPTLDGGYITASYTLGNSTPNIGYHAYNDYWIVKLDSLGNTKWEKCFGGYGDDVPCRIIQNKDGSYTVAGGSESSNGGDITNSHGNYDGWVVKLYPDSITIINSIPEFDNQYPSFSISPNPSSTSITVAIEESMVGSTLTINDVTGKVITSNKLEAQNVQLETESFANGIYFVTISNGRQSATSKLVISK